METDNCTYRVLNNFDEENLQNGKNISSKKIPSNNEVVSKFLIEIIPHVQSGSNIEKKFSWLSTSTNLYKIIEKYFFLLKNDEVVEEYNNNCGNKVAIIVNNYSNEQVFNVGSRTYSFSAGKDFKEHRKEIYNCKQICINKMVVDLTTRIQSKENIANGIILPNPSYKPKPGKSYNPVTAIGYAADVGEILVFKQILIEDVIKTIEPKQIIELYKMIKQEIDDYKKSSQYKEMIYNTKKIEEQRAFREALEIEISNKHVKKYIL